MRERHGFYEGVLRDLVASGSIGPEMSVLVVCGGTIDREVLLNVGFADVRITNVDASGADDRYQPYAWAYQDAEHLDLDDDSVNVAIVSAGLHHCHSPHRALLEMYRVARTAVVVLEARDSAALRAAARLGLADDFELSAVAAQGLRSGGVANSSIPNYVYRWTEREVEKTITSYAPHAKHRIRYFHALELPSERSSYERSGVRRIALRLAAPLAWIVSKMAPRQGNRFAIVVHKPRLPADLQPWMRIDGSAVLPDRAVIAERYVVGE